MEITYIKVTHGHKSVLILIKSTMISSLVYFFQLPLLAYGKLFQMSDHMLSRCFRETNVYRHTQEYTSFLRG